jgi:MoaA/NifB/PqqE/SkfB family radical SAM enzyme
MNLNELLGRKPNGRPCVPTLNFVIGDRTCNMSCKYCISKMTEGGLSKGGDFARLWYENQFLAFSVARKYNADTVLITSKGEPTIWKQQVLSVVSKACEEGFITELQTNGTLLDESYCNALAGCGLNTIAISRVGISTVANDLICDQEHKKSPNLTDLISRIQKFDMNVRLCFVAMRGFHDSFASILELCRWATYYKVRQVTVRRMGMPSFKYIDTSEKAKEISDFVGDRLIADNIWKEIINLLMKNYQVLRLFDWGSISWAVEGTQLLIADCLSVPGLDGIIRYLIYCPDGHLRYSWEHDSSIIF